MSTTVVASAIHNVLRFSPNLKTVPYERWSVPGESGGINHGFTNLKQEPHRIDTIPELAADPALRSLMAAINGRETGLFSSACDSALREDTTGFQAGGYIEIAFNCIHGVADPIRYAALFVRFDECLRKRRFDQPVTYEWELCPTRFLDARVDGHTAAISVITRPLSRREKAKEVWAAALAALEHVLASVPPGDGTPIYRSR